MSSELEKKGIEDRLNLAVEKLNRLKEALLLETDVSVQMKIEHDISTVEQQIEEEKNNLAILSSANISSSTPPRFRLAPHHQYTCDRTVQDEAFIKYLYDETETAKKLHFLFLHGGDLQEHKGLYKRFVHKLAGEDLDFHANYKASGTTVKDFDTLSFPKYTQADTLKIGITRELMKALAIEDHQMEKIMEKNLAFALQASPELSDLVVHDKVCFFISIPETRWDAQLTPEITKWFITYFCQNNLPNTAPDFYFFFSVEYDEDNESIKGELMTALQDAQFTKALPELAMVQKSDAQEWFTTYGIMWEKKSTRKKTFKRFFADEDDEMYMEDVQDILANIINEINNSEKDDPRNS